MKYAILILGFLCVIPASAATKVYVHVAPDFVSGFLLANASAGSSATTSVTNTITSSSALVQLTKTAAGTAIIWLSAPLSAPATLNSSETCNFWGSENSTSANATFACEIFQYTGGSLGSSLCRGNVTTELTTGATNKTSTCAITSTSFATGDRIGIEFFLINCATSGCPTGSMASGHAVTLNYDGGTGGASGDVFVSFTEALTFGADCTGPWCNVQESQNASCASGLTCAVTTTSTTAHNVLIAARTMAANNTITGITAGACNVSWVFSIADEFQTGAGGTSLAYCLDAVGSITSITVTISGTDTGQAAIFEESLSTGTPTYDTAGIRATSTSVETGVTLTLSGTVDTIVQITVPSGTATAISSPYLGFFPGGSGVAVAINQSTGAAPTWTNGSSTDASFSAVAIRQVIAGASTMPPAVF